MELSQTSIGGLWLHSDFRTIKKKINNVLSFHEKPNKKKAEQF